MYQSYAGLLDLSTILLPFFGLIGALAALQSLLVSILFSAAKFTVTMAVLVPAWLHIRRQRRKGWSEIRLKFDELPEPAVSGLNLLQ
jgi:hypothetical protein